MNNDKDIKPFGQIGTDGVIEPVTEPKILTETLRAKVSIAPSQKLITEMADTISAIDEIEEGKTTDGLLYERKLHSTDLILEGNTESGEYFKIAGCAYEIISALVRRKVNLSKTKNLELKTYKGESLLRNFHNYRDSIIQFLIYESTGRMLGSVTSKSYVFECEFDEGTYYFDIYYVLHRPSNTEFNGMKRISFYDKLHEKALSNIFEMHGKLDISETLKEWTKRLHGYEGWGQANSDKEISEIRDMFDTVCNLLTPPKDEEVEPTETADRIDEIKAFAISEQIARVRDLVQGDDKELTLKHLEVLEYLIKK